MNVPAMGRRTLGVNFDTSGQANVRVCAPDAEEVKIVTGDNITINLTSQPKGYWETITNELRPGAIYNISIDGKILPDIYSLSQPDGVHKSSVAVDLGAYKWKDDSWNNTPLSDYILYELHTGTFTKEGTFAGIESKLDYLKELGITAIELMPVAQFPGDRNWGYDGVFPFAVQHSYGGIVGLQKLVDACHTKGLAVVLDVVYNHVGPEGNYLNEYGHYFTNKYQTPWGDAVNFDDAGSDQVRSFFIENALMWLRDFHIDALRLDAVHAIRDFGPKHILKELKESVDELMQATGRTHYLIVECDLNDHRFIDPVDKNGYGMDAQWNDEFHHALRVTAGEKKQGYYSDFDSITSLKAAFEHAYVYHGQYSAQRDKTFGTDPANNPGEQFVVFSQNHDQVGNRMMGERSSTLFSFEMQKLMAATVMISPFLPLLFMGEEFGETNPFLYFVSHSDPELVEAVRKGRKEEFKSFHQAGETPDPESVDTFNNSKLQWHLLQQPPHNIMLRYYKALIALRKTHPVFKDTDRRGLKVEANEENQTIIITRDKAHLTVCCLLNFSKKIQTVRLPGEFTNCRQLFNSAAAEWNGPVQSQGLAQGVSAVDVAPESILIFEQHV